MAKNYDVTLNRADGTPPTYTWSPTTVTTLAYLDTVTIALGTGWPSGSAITGVAFHGNKLAGDQDQKDPTKSRGTWKSTAPTAQPVSGEVRVSLSSTTKIVIQNTDTATDNDKLWFGMTVHTNKDESPDPELILKKQTGGARIAEA